MMAMVESNAYGDDDGNDNDIKPQCLRGIKSATHS